MTKPVYFPHTYIAPAAAAALRSAFTSVAAYQPVSSRRSPDMQALAEDGFLEVVAPAPECERRLDRILQEFERWACLQQDGGGLLSVFLSSRPGADPLTADGTAGQIAAEIRRPPSGAPRPDPQALMRAGAFLQLVHDADRQRGEASAALQRCERDHAALLDALAGEDARPHPDSVALPDGFRTPESDSLLDQRVRAWARLFVHRPYPGPVFVTSSPEVVRLLAEKFPALRRIHRSAIEPAAGIPAASGFSAAGGFMARLEMLASRPLPDADPSDEGGNDSLLVYAAPDLSPLRLFTILAEGGEAAETGAAEPGWRHTIVVELSRRALQPSLRPSVV